MNKKKIIGILIGVSVLIVIINIFISKDNVSRAEYNKLVDKNFDEKQQLRSEIKDLQAEKLSLENEVKRLKEAQSKPVAQATQTQPVQQEQPKKEEPKQEQQQTTDAFENPMKKIDKAGAMDKVKEKAKQDFPDDYSTQNYVAKKQSEAFDYLNRIAIKSQEELNIMNNALRDFPNDFSTAKYVYEKQMKAKSEQ
ncbi:hypothetical protein CON64_09795 [Bacillus pseudomycoides]|nr:hypothetical protein CON64_09795 [Bacillus pseudomycoides]